jgi:hypothetical protein
VVIIKLAGSIERTLDCEEVLTRQCGEEFALQLVAVTEITYSLQHPSRFLSVTYHLGLTIPYGFAWMPTAAEQPPTATQVERPFLGPRRKMLLGNHLP